MALSQSNARSILIPAPVGGWNTRDPWYAMPPEDARILDNWFPEANYLRAWGGFSEFADVGGGSRVHSLMTMTTAAGSEKLVAGSSGILADISAGGAGTSIKGAATISDNLMQYTVFRHRMFIVNGVDAPLDWTGSGNVTATAWTGSGLTITNLVNVATYKRRLYFVEKDTANVWYTESVDNITGTLIKADFSSRLTKGGSVLYAGGTSKGTVDASPAELFVVISSEGEVLVYAGDNPLSSSWQLIGSYVISKPMGARSSLSGYRSAFKIFGDVNIITRDGVISVDALVSGRNDVSGYNSISAKIRPTFNEQSLVYSASVGWQGILWPEKHVAFINHGQNGYMYGVNVQTGAWFRAVQADPALSYAIFNGQMYIGSNTTDKVRAVDVQFGTIPAAEKGHDLGQALNFFGAPEAEKKMNFIQPYWSVDGSGTGSVAFNFGFDKDFELQAVYPAWTLSWTTTETFSSPIYDVAGVGRAFGLRLGIINTTHVEIRLYSTIVHYEIGGEIA